MGTAAYSIHCWLITRLYVFYHKRYGIDDTHRLVYRVEDGQIEVYQCKGHYED